MILGSLVFLAATLNYYAIVYGSLACRGNKITLFITEIGRTGE